MTITEMRENDAAVSDINMYHPAIIDDLVVASSIHKAIKTMIGADKPTQEHSKMLAGAQWEEDQALGALDKLIERHIIDFAAKAIRAGATIDTVPCPACGHEIGQDESTCWHCQADQRARQCA